MMKTSVLVAGVILYIFSCSKNNDVTNSSTKNTNDSIRNYVSSKGITLQLTKSVWFTQKKNGFGSVMLVVSGSTNADYVSVLSYGDGLLYDSNIKLDSNKKFTNDTIEISFTHAPSDKPVDAKTTITAYTGSDTLTVRLNGGQLKY